MPELDFLKKNIEEKKKVEKEAQSERAPPETQTENIEQVEKIVERMKQKYKESGLEFEEAGGKMGELRKIVAEGKTSDVEIQRVEDLSEMRDPTIKQIGNFYLKFQKIFSPIANIISKLPLIEKLDFYLYSANMKFSLKQYIAISTVITLLVFIFGMVLFTAGYSMLKLNIFLTLVLVIVSSFFMAIFALVIVLLIPSNKAKARGSDITTELPFALRHMSTELKAGLGLYRTLQTIASADYGVLSEEFSRTINEVEEGTDTKDALKHMAARVQSKELSNALIHIVRALKTGGNLSEVMNDIAKDVAFSVQTNIRDFAEKMNFFGVVFIFFVIVGPVMVAILGGIRNTPLSSLTGVDAFSALPLDPFMLAVFYLGIMPVALFMMIMYLRMIQPKI